MNTTTDVLTCSFGPLSTGTTTSLTTWVVFSLPPAHTEVDATATRVSSSPADPDPTNDSASVTCRHLEDNTGFPPHPWRLHC
jgi:hypothetical protein